MKNNWNQEMSNLIGALTINNSVNLFWIFKVHQKKARYWSILTSFFPIFLIFYTWYSALTSLFQLTYCLWAFFVRWQQRSALPQMSPNPRRSTWTISHCVLLPMKMWTAAFGSKAGHCNTIKINIRVYIEY